MKKVKKKKKIMIIWDKIDAKQKVEKIPNIVIELIKTYKIKNKGNKTVYIGHKINVDNYEGYPLASGREMDIIWFKNESKPLYGIMKGMKKSKRIM